MSNIRRWYFYIVSAVTLQIVTWSVIVLLRNRTIDSVAFQAAVIIVALPLFLIHWRWAGRSERTSDEFGNDHLRVLYLFTMLAAFLIPIIFNVRTLFAAAVRLALGVRQTVTYYPRPLPDGELIINSAVAIAVLTLLTVYHVYLIREENLVEDVGYPATLRRIFIYLFAAMGLYMFSYGLFRLLIWMRSQISTLSIIPTMVDMVNAVALLLTGLLVWIPFWRYAQRLFHSGLDEERESALRKVYLYLVVFIATIIVASDLTIIGATLLRRLLGLAPPEDTGAVLSSLIVGALLWVYHAYVLMDDSRAAPDNAAQAGIRRVYRYTVSTVGLLALLIGLGSTISVILNAVGGPSGVTESLREQLAWSVAGLIAGVVIWLLPWHKIQQEVELPEPQSTIARSAGARRNYLYGFILLATLTFLICIVYLVYALLTRVLGVSDADISFTQMAQAFAYALMAIIVWLYHGSILRQDNALIKVAKTPFGEEPGIAVVDDGDGHLAGTLMTALAAALPKARLSALGLTVGAQAALAGREGALSTAEVLAAADIIVGPWTAVTPYVGPRLVDESAFTAVAGSPAHKVLIPTALENWDWSGTPAWKEEDAVRQAVQAVRQIVAGDPVQPKKPLGVGRVLLIVLGFFFLILLLFAFFSGFLGI